ncbi:branched-subunit amino acid transport protein [Hydrogenoanaerobacterium saccharovorans]|uniref:Branched-chain amino acid transport protein n=1 Tax=Hydrogenoanaerobacterium saccharovorans TaxID=474960 RepID=A0A1H8ALG3_9FIRM|nr:AzlD domain-containing protein [Hydrogenoanaerobacterium saccharovorans]RPF47870.1 branched-subunit amino acid transport protein [Hydrogenoanaerobacterium saccharovorans]SEM71612.1 Branched-chain amino acid transport protein [Hydrogenoanaerobacterium saccharovorans]
MNYTRIFTAIAVMALVTYIPRMLPLTFMKRKIQNRFIQSFLQYVPYAVLAAMTFPDILYSTSALVSAVVGLFAALALAYWNKSLITVALGSTAAVFITEQIVKIIT